MMDTRENGEAGTTKKTADKQGKQADRGGREDKQLLLSNSRKEAGNGEAETKSNGKSEKQEERGKEKTTAI